MNWGTKILIVYVVFIAGILLMVFKSSSQKTDLVTTNYYEKELKYQDKIEEMKRVSALSTPIKYEVKAGSITIQFPKDFAGKKLVGEAVLYCPADENKDIKKPFAVQDEMLQLSIPPASKGLYELHLSWQGEGVTYYFEKKIYL